MSGWDRYWQSRERTTLANSDGVSLVRKGRRKVILASMACTFLAMIAASMWLYTTCISSWASADDPITKVHVPDMLLAYVPDTVSGFESGAGVLFEMVGSYAMPALALVGLFVTLVTRSLMMLPAVILASVFGGMVSVIAPPGGDGAAPATARQVMSESIDNLEIHRARQLFNDLHASAVMRDYVLAQMSLIAARENEDGSASDEVAALIEGSGRDFANEGSEGMSWSVLYRMEREVFGEARSATALAFAERLRSERERLGRIKAASTWLWILALGGAFSLLLLARSMRRRAGRLEELIRRISTHRPSLTSVEAQEK